ncbi:hypothetical protein Shyd_61280 [Streptomyces hydrogenans]|uniref:Uncharacterized protein n=1 Tax=Streptomyces hydrogenans TaxID=1873719 RepID=A0ABQ3PIA5_9ACTN|nr:hypothetical protein GCM10018784_15370 [Streptomyces hydrogenans]GHI24757.1 hypothetical protein Shyd_61280 [Streptomyces hydrogenans]
MRGDGGRQHGEQGGGQHERRLGERQAAPEVRRSGGCHSGVLVFAVDRGAAEVMLLPWLSLRRFSRAIRDGTGTGGTPGACGTGRGGTTRFTPLFVAQIT